HGTSFDEENRKGFGYSQMYNLTGWPTATVRVGTSPEGLPLGVQVAARPWREDVALALVAHLEKTFGGWKMPTAVKQMPKTNLPLDADRIWADVMGLADITDPARPYTRRSFTALFLEGRAWLAQRFAD